MPSSPTLSSSATAALAGAKVVFGRLVNSYKSTIQQLDSLQTEVFRTKVQANKDVFSVQCQLPGTPMSGVLWPATPEAEKPDLPSAAKQMCSVFEKEMMKAIKAHRTLGKAFTLQEKQQEKLQQQHNNLEERLHQKRQRREVNRRRSRSPAGRSAGGDRGSVRRRSPSPRRTNPIPPRANAAPSTSSSSSLSSAPTLVGGPSISSSSRPSLLSSPVGAVDAVPAIAGHSSSSLSSSHPTPSAAAAPATRSPTLPPAAGPAVPYSSSFSPSLSSSSGAGAGTSVAEPAGSPKLGSPKMSGLARRRAENAALEGMEKLSLK